MAQETGTTAGKLSTASNQSNRQSKMDPAEQLQALRATAFSNFVHNINLSQQNAVSNQQAMNQLGMAVVARLVTLLTGSEEAQTAANERIQPLNELTEAFQISQEDAASLQPQEMVDADQPADYSQAIVEVKRENSVFIKGLERQNLVQRRQAYFQVGMAIIARCAGVILRADAAGKNAPDQQKMCRELLETFLEQAKMLTKAEEE
jgi:hypothetical protein